MKLNKEKVIGAIQKVDGLIEGDYYISGECCVIGACLLSIGWDEERFDLINDGIDEELDALSDLVKEFGGDQSQWCEIQGENDEFVLPDRMKDHKIQRKKIMIEFIKDMPEAE